MLVTFHTCHTDSNVWCIAIHAIVHANTDNNVSLTSLVFVGDNITFHQANQLCYPIIYRKGNFKVTSNKNVLYRIIGIEES